MIPETAKTIRGFMGPKRGITAKTAEARFRENCAAKNITVVCVVFCRSIGMGVYTINAIIDEGK